MTIAILIALASCGGFFFGRYFLDTGLQRQAARYYRTLYNEQMGELIVQYRSARAADRHRLEGQIADLEWELRELSRLLDPERTAITKPTTNKAVLDEVSA